MGVRLGVRPGVVGGGGGGGGCVLCSVLFFFFPPFSSCLRPTGAPAPESEAEGGKRRVTVNRVTGVDPFFLQSA